jgi:hypothetical protein
MGKTKVDYTHEPIRVIDEAIKGKKLTVADATTILKARAERDSRSGRNAAAWLKARGIKVTGKNAQVAPRSTTTASTTRVELSPEKNKEFNALAKLHAEETVGYYTEADFTVRRGNPRRNVQALLDAGKAVGDARKGFQMALRNEKKRLCEEFANA